MVMACGPSYPTVSQMSLTEMTDSQHLPTMAHLHAFSTTVRPTPAEPACSTRDKNRANIIHNGNSLVNGETSDFRDETERSSQFPELSPDSNPKAVSARSY